ncbi:MAG: alpha/beta hydrolase [Verrucomicrobiota bacterium]
MKSILLLICTALALLGWTLWKIPEFVSVPKPAASFEEALNKFETLRSAEAALPLSEQGASRLLHHGQKTDRAFVLLHGLTNCPEQFVAFATILHAAGHNVVIPRARLAGYRDRLNGEQGLQTAQDLLDQASLGIDIAAGLGNRTTLVGLSGSAVAAAWMAQNRDGIEDVAILSPFFGAYGLPTPAVDAAGAIFSRLPNFYVWWDPDKKDDLPGPPHAYPRFGTRCMADSVQLSRNVRGHLESMPPRSQRVLFITTANDVAANNSLTDSISKTLAAQNGLAEVLAFEFPPEADIPHDMIDPAQPGANTPLVYPKLLELLGVQAPVHTDG